MGECILARRISGGGVDIETLAVYIGFGVNISIGGGSSRGSLGVARVGEEKRGLICGQLSKANTSNVAYNYIVDWEESTVTPLNSAPYYAYHIDRTNNTCYVQVKASDFSTSNMWDCAYIPEL